MAVQPVVRYLRRNFDELLIVGALARLAISDEALNTEEQAVALALRRSSPNLHDATPEELSAYLQRFDEEQIPGLVSNIKGILHEVEFVEVENADGDRVQAALFAETNHPDTDVLLTDTATGESWEIQLKATDDAGYVRDWLEAHPDGEIVVTQELAEQLDLPTSGLENQELTVRTEQVIEKLCDLDENDSLWDYFPVIGVVSVAVLIWELWRQHLAGEMTRVEFQRIAARLTGLKLAKIGLLTLLLSIPGVNVVTGIYLVARLLLTMDSVSDGLSQGAHKYLIRRNWGAASVSV